MRSRVQAAERRAPECFLACLHDDPVPKDSEARISRDLPVSLGSVWLTH